MELLIMMMKKVVVIDSKQLKLLVETNLRTTVQKLGIKLSVLAKTIFNYLKR